MKDNYFEFRMREDARKLQSDDLLGTLNYIVIPGEIRGVNFTDVCRTCDLPFIGLNTIAFSCGHMYHMKEECVLLTKDGTCPQC